MFFKLFLLFAIIPVVEIAILIKIGGIIGAFYTVAIVIGTAIIGAYLVRLQGVSIMLRFQNNLQQGIFPAEEMIDGAMALVAGAVLLTPGLITDIIGFTLLLPPTRKIIKGSVKKFIKSRAVSFTHAGPGGPHGGGPHAGGPFGRGPHGTGGCGGSTREEGGIIEGEWEHPREPEDEERED